MTATIAGSICGYPGPSPLDADGLRISLAGTGIQGFGGFFPGAGKAVDLTFWGYRMAWDLQCSPSTLTAHGEVVVKGRGRFALQSSRQEGGSCSHDPARGTSVFTGANGVSFAYDGASPCDACVPYTSDAGLTGALCWQ